MAELRPEGLDDGGLLAALKLHAQQVSKRLALPISVTGVAPQPRMPRVVETALFRIVQEALTNVAKHARAKKAAIRLDCAAQDVSLSIEDDGVGFDPDGSASGYGLQTMRERAEAVGARLDIESAPGRGARLVVTLRAAA